MTTVFLDTARSTADFSVPLVAFSCAVAAGQHGHREQLLCSQVLTLLHQPQHTYFGTLRCVAGAMRTRPQCVLGGLAAAGHEAWLQQCFSHCWVDHSAQLGACYVATT